MADEESVSEEEEPAAKKGPGAVLWLIVVVVAAGGGFAASAVLVTPATAEVEEEEAPPTFEMLSPDQTVVVPFGEVTVNLDEGRMNRYLRLKISTLVAKSEEQDVIKAIEAQNAVLKNWLLSHLSDKGLEEIRGKAGLNMLRREIRRQFNETLFSDRRDRVYDILFEEFNVQ